MQRYADDKMIQRNTRLGKILLYGGLGLLILGVVISVGQPEAQLTVVTMAMVGMLTSQMGMAFTARWGRRPRIDEILDDAFKGMDSRTSIFHYCLRTYHALITPNGVYAILPRADHGTVTYHDGAWTLEQEKTGWLRRPGTRTLKGIERDARLEAELLSDALHKHLPEVEGIEPGAIVIFANPHVTVHAESAPLPAFHVKKAKEGVRKLERRPTLTEEQVEALAQKLRLK